MPARLAAGLLAALALLTPAAQAQEKPNPIVAAVKASLKDPSRPFTLVIDVQLKEGSGPKFEAAFAKARKATRQEKGCVAYDLNRDTKTPTRYLIYERWRDLPALEAHLKAEHTTTLLRELGEWLAAPPEVRIQLPAGE